MDTNKVTLWHSYNKSKTWKELRVDFQMKYKMILKLYELFHMQEFVLSTLVPFMQFLSQSSKPLKSATSDTSH